MGDRVREGKGKVLWLPVPAAPGPRILTFPNFSVSAVIGWLEPDSRVRGVEEGLNFGIQAGLLKPQSVQGTYQFTVDFTDITASKTKVISIGVWAKGRN